jgi:hypothetical protein
MIGLALGLGLGLELGSTHAPALHTRALRQSVSLLHPVSRACVPEHDHVVTHTPKTRAASLRLRKIIRESLRELLEVATRLF